jgi:hypothetical protein
MAIDWPSPDAVVDQLGEKFIRSLLGNMPTGSTVRLGETGNGTAPNYQVESADAVTIYRGRNHSEWTGDTDAFDEGKISGPFDREQIFAVFVARYRKPRAGR